MNGVGRVVEDEVVGRLQDVERRHSESTALPARSKMVGPGQTPNTVRVTLPTGYDDVIESWREQFGDAVVVEVVDLCARGVGEQEPDTVAQLDSGGTNSTDNI